MATNPDKDPACTAVPSPALHQLLRSVLSRQYTTLPSSAQKIGLQPIAVTEVCEIARRFCLSNLDYQNPSWTKAFQQTKDYHSPYTGQHAQTAAAVAALLRMALPPTQSQEQNKHALRKHPKGLHAAPLIHPPTPILRIDTQALSSWSHLCPANTRTAALQACLTAADPGQSPCEVVATQAQREPGA